MAILSRLTLLIHEHGMPLPSSTIFYLFLQKFTVYFLFIMVTANKVGFFFSRKTNIQRKVLDFVWEFVSCYTDENVYWIYKFSCNVLGSFMVFHRWDQIVCKYNLTSFILYPSYFLPCIIAMAKISNLDYINYGYFCFIPDFKGNFFQFICIQYNVGYIFVVNDFCYV